MNINLNREQQAFMDDQKTKSIYPFIEDDNQQAQYQQTQTQTQYQQPEAQYQQTHTQEQYQQPQAQAQYSQYQQPEAQYPQYQPQAQAQYPQYQQPPMQYPQYQPQMQQSDQLFNSDMIDRAFKSQKVNNFKYSPLPQQSLKQNNNNYNQWMKMFDNNKNTEEGTIPMTINNPNSSNYYQQPQAQMQKQPKMQQLKPKYQDSIQQMMSQPQIQKEINEKIKKEINHLAENQQIKFNNQNQKHYNSSEEISKLTLAISELSSRIQNQKTCNHSNSKNVEEKNIEVNKPNYFFEPNFFSHELKVKISILDNLYKNNGISNENFKKVKKDILLREINDYY